MSITLNFTITVTIADQDNEFLREDGTVDAIARDVMASDETLFLKLDKYYGEGVGVKFKQLARS